jgi:carboxyl-terminal processing protease
MIQIAKRVSVLILVCSVSWLGVVAGQGVTRQIYQAVYVQAASATDFAAAEKDSGDKSDKSEKVDKKKASADLQERYRNLELFQKVLHFIEANYVEEVKNDELIKGAIKGMMETLDPHSNFLPPDVFKDMKIDTSGKFGGLGIEIGVKDSLLTVIAPIEETPAWKAGLRPDDRILKIDNETTKGMTLVEAVSKMRGKPKTSVKLNIFREGFEKPRDVSIVRDIIKIRSVRQETIEPGFGYVRLTQFNESAAEDIKKALKTLEDKGKLKGLVFDLRTNPGGLLDQAVEVSSLFLDEGVVVSTIGRNKAQKDVKYARKGVARKDLPVAVLVNSSTASAAEIVAGALQDHHRALILGQTTFGKGSVQTVIELGNDMGLKLTIARYYTPSGRSIQEKGVQPDIILDEFDNKLLAKAKLKRDFLRERDLKGHMVNEEGGDKDYSKDEIESLIKKDEKKRDGDKADDEMTPVKLNPKEDFQVKEAINYLKSFDIMKKISSGAKLDKPGT